MRARRLSTPTTSERIRERTTTSSESSSIGICTRRPSLVTTTATRRRSRPFEVRTVRAVYVDLFRRATTPNPSGIEVVMGAGVSRESERPPGAGGRPSARALRRYPQRCPAWSTSAELAMVIRAMRRRRYAALKVIFMAVYQRIPAPIVRAIAPSSMMAEVKRARFAFTRAPSQRWDDRSLRSRQLGGLPAEVPGFASPPRDGFALDNLGAVETNVVS
jgi:hypothetical protein